MLAQSLIFAPSLVPSPVDRVTGDSPESLRGEATPVGHDQPKQSNGHHGQCPDRRPCHTHLLRVSPHHLICYLSQPLGGTPHYDHPPCSHGLTSTMAAVLKKRAISNFGFGASPRSSIASERRPPKANARQATGKSKQPKYIILVGCCSLRLTFSL